MRGLLLGLGLALAAWGGPVKVLLVTGSSDEPYHHWRETSAELRRMMTQRGFEVKVVEEPRGLGAASFEGYTAVVLDYNGARLPAAAERGLEEFVKRGGGLAAFHQACYGEWFGMKFREGKWQAGDAGWREFPKMLGAHWEPERLGHARRAPFVVEWRAKEHPVAKGLAERFWANDELYHRLTLEPGVEVLAEAHSPMEIGGTGEREPMAWVNRYGAGRVFFTPMGHDTMAWYQEGLREMFLRGVEWAATGAVAAREKAPAAVRLLVVTGGHGYPKEFYAMLDSLEGVKWTHAASQAEAFGKPLKGRFDAVLLHDMAETLAEPLRANLKAFVEAGGGVVSTHHAIVDYTDWPWWWQEVTGGKYFVQGMAGHAPSRYHEDVEFEVAVAKGQERHPVVAGVGPLWVDDEAYRGMWLAPGSQVLMETGFEENDRAVVYVGPCRTARVVYVQLGHSARTMGDPGYRRLVGNAVRWVAGRSN